jgi:hypothetical protein
MTPSTDVEGATAVSVFEEGRVVIMKTATGGQAVTS